jgi:hypothetical protein
MGLLISMPGYVHHTGVLIAETLLDNDQTQRVTNVCQTYVLSCPGPL